MANAKNSKNSKPSTAAKTAPKAASKSKKAPAPKKTAITVSAGKVPGSVVQFTVPADGDQTVIGVIRKAAEIIGEQKKLGKPAYEVNTRAYEGSADVMKVDVPYLNGVPLANKEKMKDGGTRWTNIDWTKVVKDGDKVTMTPKIQGN